MAIRFDRTLDEVSTLLGDSLEAERAARAPGFLQRRDPRAKIAGALLTSPVLALVGILSSARRTAALRKGARALGKLAALLGTQYQEYAVVHGD